MIKKLTIKNFAIIDEMAVKFDEGFNVITGETGAGKSLIVNAIDMLFGARISHQMVRLDGDPLEVKAIFRVGDRDMVFSMKYTEGKSQRFIDDKKISKSKFLENFPNLVQFQKQHDSNNLLNSNKHIDFLDNYCSDFNSLRELKKSYHRYIECEKLYKDLLEDASHYKDKLSLYKYQSEELNSINLNQNDEMLLNKKYKKYNHSKKIRDILNNYNIDSTNNKSLLPVLEKLIKSLAKFSDLDKGIEEIVSRVEQLVIELKDINEEVFNLEKKYYFNSDELNVLESQIQKYEEVKRKYGGSIQSAISYKESIDRELAKMPDFDDKIKSLKADFLKNKLIYEKIALSVSNTRLKSAVEMSEKINQYLVDMDMPDAKIKIKIKQLDDYSEKGFDRCEIFAITNKGEQYKPIKQIASGGEISRIMLSFNLVMEKVRSSNTLVFDEVDTGISGSTASNIGHLLNKLSKRRQLIIVTHLPQIASRSNSHLYVYKKESKNRIVSAVKDLREGGHSSEIARMLSGKKVTNHSIEQAKEMIANG